MTKLQELYRKLQEFEDNLSPEFKNKLECKNGCSRCCYVDLSVFQVEAENIRLWFSSLDQVQARQLKELWKNAPLKETENFQGEISPSCVFLKNESCTIYQARPLICRTQGLALKVKWDTEELLDICPLNEDALTNLRSQDVLNLDLLNHLLSAIEQEDASGKERKRAPLKDLMRELVVDKTQE